MRISTEIDDAGYSPDARNIKVFLDGVEQKYCLTADEEIGYVKVLSVGVANAIEVRNGEFQTIEKYGKVEIKNEGDL